MRRPACPSSWWRTPSRPSANWRTPSLVRPFGGAPLKCSCGASLAHGHKVLAHCFMHVPVATLGEVLGGGQAVVEASVGCGGMFGRAWSGQAQVIAGRWANAYKQLEGFWANQHENKFLCTLFTDSCDVNIDPRQEDKLLYSYGFWGQRRSLLSPFRGAGAIEWRGTHPSKCSVWNGGLVLPSRSPALRARPLPPTLAGALPCLQCCVGSTPEHHVFALVRAHPALLWHPWHSCG
jgi:hypothetical protein